MAPKSNGFFKFTLEWKAQNGKNMNIKEATAQAGHLWKAMTEQQRRPYIEKAKQSKHHKPAEKLCCTGHSITHVLNQKLELEQKERDMKRSTELIVRNSVDNDEITKQSYIFIMANYFTRKVQGGEYVPAELSLSEYSLGEGITRVYHTLINPGDTLYGLQFHAQDYAKKSHQLPLPPNAKGETNLRSIYEDVLQFVRDADGKVKAPLFTLHDSTPIVESVLRFLSDYDQDDEAIPLNIYSIQHLFYVLKEATCQVGEVEKPQSHFITDSYFESDFFEYQSGISCDYHEEIDKTKYCTRSYVTRWGYMFSDYMCKDVAIVPIPGRHIPGNFKIVGADDAASVRRDTGSVVDSEYSRGGFYYKNQLESSSVSTRSVYSETKPGQFVGRSNKQAIDFSGPDDKDDGAYGGWQKVEKNRRCPKAESFNVTYKDDELAYDRDLPLSSNYRNRREITYNMPPKKQT